MRKIVKLFQPRFAPMVRDGTKLNTIRPLPKRPQDMPKVGWEISLREWEGKPYRSKQRVLKESVITRVEMCEITEFGATIEGEGHPDLAERDGFKDWPDMRSWFDSTHGLPFKGVFIGWDLSESQTEKLENIFGNGGCLVDIHDFYWITGDHGDSGGEYCRECAAKKCSELNASKPREHWEVDGGFSLENDSLPFCETCSKRLDGSLTQYGCTVEVDHFTESGFNPDSPDDCYSMERVIGSSGWHPFDFSTDSDHQYFGNLQRLGFKILNP